MEVLLVDEEGGTGMDGRTTGFIGGPREADAVTVVNFR
jgi:hypothetical protein